MEKRYLSWKEAKEYTSMGDLELQFLLIDNKVCVYQREKWGRKYIDKFDIDKAFKKAKKENNYLDRR